ncbi:hypothetical protein ACHAWF_010785, partial [Thalassiosira exigua]
KLLTTSRVPPLCQFSAFAMARTKPKTAGGRLSASTRKKGKGNKPPSRRGTDSGEDGNATPCAARRGRPPRGKRAPASAKTPTSAKTPSPTVARGTRNRRGDAPPSAAAETPSSARGTRNRRGDAPPSASGETPSSPRARGLRVPASAATKGQRRSKRVLELQKEAGGVEPPLLQQEANGAEGVAQLLLQSQKSGADPPAEEEPPQEPPLHQQSEESEGDEDEEEDDEASRYVPPEGESSDEEDKIPPKKKPAKAKSAEAKAKSPPAKKKPAKDKSKNAGAAKTKGTAEAKAKSKHPAAKAKSNKHPLDFAENSPQKKKSKKKDKYEKVPEGPAREKFKQKIGNAFTHHFATEKVGCKPGSVGSGENDALVSSRLTLHLARESGRTETRRKHRYPPGQGEREKAKQIAMVCPACRWLKNDGTLVLKKGKTIHKFVWDEADFNRVCRMIEQGEKKTFTENKRLCPNDILNSELWTETYKGDDGAEHPVLDENFVQGITRSVYEHYLDNHEEQQIRVMDRHGAYLRRKMQKEQRRTKSRYDAAVEMAAVTEELEGGLGSGEEGGEATEMGTEAAEGKA